MSAPVPAWLAGAQPLCAAVAQLLHPYAEVVVHDVESDRIVAIWNAFSGRSVGDHARLAELAPRWSDEPVVGPFERTAGGRSVSAISAVVPDEEGVVRGLVCVNFDRAPLDELGARLAAFAAPAAERAPALSTRDWREQIALVIGAECRERGLRPDDLGREDRRELVAALEDRGLFATRHAAEHVGRALGVSRATVYAVLKEVRA